MKAIRRLRNRLFLVRKYPNLTGYYSQYGQDIFLVEELFQGKTGGFFVDIGAHDGITLSNTYYLEKNLGWTGICVEPNPTVYAKLLKNRKCICLNGAVSDRKGESVFLKVDGYSEMLSGLLGKYDPKHLQRIEKELRLFGGTKRQITVPCLDLNEVLTQHNVRHVDYLSIDTEGSEFDILKSVNFDHIKCAAISVENNFGEGNLEKLLKSRGFKLIAIIGTDEFYLKN
jgi:FkbM family methyltransferase